MLESLAVAVLLLASGLAYTAGRMRELRQRIGEKDKLIETQTAGLQALTNRLTIKSGVQPVYDELGNVAIALSQPSGNPVMQILKPPIAAAEEQWEREEEEARQAFALSSLVPPLTEADKQRMRTSIIGE
jgi:hypothetical protein